MRPTCSVASSSPQPRPPPRRLRASSRSRRYTPRMHNMCTPLHTPRKRHCTRRCTRRCTRYCTRRCTRRCTRHCTYRANATAHDTAHAAAQVPGYFVRLLRGPDGLSAERRLQLLSFCTGCGPHGQSARPRLQPSTTALDYSPRLQPSTTALGRAQARLPAAPRDAWCLRAARHSRVGGILGFELRRSMLPMCSLTRAIRWPRQARSTAGGRTATGREDHAPPAARRRRRAQGGGAHVQPRGQHGHHTPSRQRHSRPPTARGALAPCARRPAGLHARTIGPHAPRSAAAVPLRGAAQHRDFAACGPSRRAAPPRVLLRCDIAGDAASHARLAHRRGLGRLLRRVKTRTRRGRRPGRGPSPERKLLRHT